MVVVEGTAPPLNVSGFPVPTNVPPHEPVYHCTTAPVPNVPALAVRFSDGGRPFAQ